MNKILSTYGLAREPFTKDIAPAEMLQTEPLQEALQSLKAAIEGRTSAVVTGDSGCGKTCLLRALEEDLPQGRYRLHYAYNSTVNRRDFYRQLSIGMGLEPHSSFAALHASVSQHIQELASQHKLRVIIVLDEAQLLSVQVLEQLHILLNFEKDSKPWLSLILIGLAGSARNPQAQCPGFADGANAHTDSPPAARCRSGQALHPASHEHGRVPARCLQ